MKLFAELLPKHPDAVEVAVCRLDAGEVRRQLHKADAPLDDRHWELLNVVCMEAAKDREFFFYYLAVLRVFADETTDRPDAGEVLRREIENARARADRLWHSKPEGNQTYPHERVEMVEILVSAKDRIPAPHIPLAGARMFAIPISTIVLRGTTYRIHEAKAA